MQKILRQKMAIFSSSWKFKTLMSNAGSGLKQNLFLPLFSPFAEYSRRILSGVETNKKLFGKWSDGWLNELVNLRRKVLQHPTRVATIGLELLHYYEFELKIISALPVYARNCNAPEIYWICLSYQRSASSTFHDSLLCFQFQFNTLQKYRFSGFPV